MTTWNWPVDATEEQKRILESAQALMDHVLAALLAGRDRGGRRELIRSAATVEKAYARIREHAPNWLSGEKADYAKLFFTLRAPGNTSENILPARRELVHVLASLEYRFFWTTCSRGIAWATPPTQLNNERTNPAEMEQELLAALYRELGPAFDASLIWPPGGCDPGEAGDLVETEGQLGSLKAVGYYSDYCLRRSYEGHADEEACVSGFVEGCGP